MIFIFKIKYFLKALLMRVSGKMEVIKVEPFVAFGNEKQVFFKGRVIAPYKQSRPKAKNFWFVNIIAAIRRYSNSSIPYALVEIKFGQIIKEVITDEDGVFELLLEAPRKQFGLKEKAFFRINEASEVQDCIVIEKEIVRYNKPLGIISDIDDTVLISHSTALGKKLWLSISKNAYTRRPFPGVSQFYQKLSSHGDFPVFYVSSSDWALFDLINDFLMFRNIPLGPILLKDKHINIKNIWKSGGGNHSHKFDKICFLMDFFTETTFYLIGDSGQHDPEIYAEVIKKYPGRVKAVFIRIVKKINGTRVGIIDQKIEGVHFFFVEDTEEAIQIAKNLKYIK
jgi:phosphatidate phosphatase APP1